MQNSTSEDESPPHEAASGANFDLALVVSASAINRIVVSRIAEQTGLKVLGETPETATAALLSRSPGTVILDGGADDRDCDVVLESLTAQRRMMNNRKPIVILLSNTQQMPGHLPADHAIDVVVAKPVTPDRLQPLIRSLVERVRD